MRQTEPQLESLEMSVLVLGGSSGGSRQKGVRSGKDELRGGVCRLPTCADLCNLAAWAGKGHSPWRNVQGNMNVDLESLPS